MHTTRPRTELRDLGVGSKGGLSVTREELGVSYPGAAPLTQYSVSENSDFAFSLPGCYKGIFFNVGKIKLN